MIVIWGGILIVLLVILLTSLVNALTFPRLKKETPEQTPFVSILIPARNEAQSIGPTVRQLLAQRNYPDFEVIVLDDASEDETKSVAQTAAAGDDRFQVIEGKPLPADWLGKNWGCHQLASVARGKVLIFTDADVRWQPGALAAVISLMERHNADMLTVWPTQETQTWGERLVVPLMSLAIIGYLPEFMVRLSPLAMFAAANGQCLAFRREDYRKSGGHAAVRNNITEDIALAKRLKKSGGKLVMSDGNLLIGCRMYHNWVEVRDGFAKNILAGHGNSLLFLLVSTVFHWMVFVVPLVWLVLGGLVELGPGWPWWPLGLVIAGIGVRAISAAVTRQRVLDALYMPVSVWLMTRIAVRSACWRITGGPRWKGRTISTQAKGAS